MSPGANRWLRFVAGGAVNTAVTYALYLALAVVAPYQVAYLIAYVTGIALAYVINSKLVFATPLSLGRASTYPLIYVVQYLAAAGLLALLVEVAGMSETYAPLAVIVAMIPVSYGLNWLALRSKLRASESGSGLPDP